MGDEAKQTPLLPTFWSVSIGRSVPPAVLLHLGAPWPEVTQGTAIAASEGGGRSLLWAFPHLA